MGIGNFFKGIGAQIKPGGATFGSYNKKKKEEDENNKPVVITPTPKPSLQIQNPNNVFKQQPPVNLTPPKFNTVQVPKNDDMPEPSPQRFATTAPKQSFWNKVRDIGDSNTEADQYRRGMAEQNDKPLNQRNPEGVRMIKDTRKSPIRLAGETAVGAVSNLPEVGLAATRAATGLVQGALNLPHDITALAATGTEKLANKWSNPVTRQVNRGVQDVNTGVKTALHHTVNNVFDPVNRFLDRTAQAYEDKVPTASGGAEAYRATQVPLNALALLLSGGSSAAGNAGRVGEVAEGAETASKGTNIISKVSNLLNKPIANTSDTGIISKVSGAITDKTAPIVETLNSPVKTGVNKAKAAINARRAAQTEEEILAATEGSNALGALGENPGMVDVPNQPVDIPVSTGINVNAPESVGTPINVRNLSNDAPLIQDVAGGADTAASGAVDLAETTRQRQIDDFALQNWGRPDPRIEGVTARNPATTILKNDIEEARNTVDDALRTGKIGADDHAALTDEINKLKAVDETPTGKKIEVKQANTIPVQDTTAVPEGLPEKPGQVRVTTQADPIAEKSAQVAATAPAVSDVAATTAETAASATAAPRSQADTVADRLPRPGETDEEFLRRIAPDLEGSMQRSVRAIKDTKKMTSAERAERAAAGERAYQEAKAAGKSFDEQEAARKAAYKGKMERMGYEGTPVANEDEARIRDMIDSHYKDMPYKKGDVREAFAKLFHGGEPGYYSEPGNHMIKSDIRNIRRFLNEAVPEANLGDAAEEAIKDLAATENGAGKIAKVLGLQRALRFTADASATARQSLAAGLSHPGDFAAAAKDAFRVMFSSKNYDELVKELSASKTANYVQDRLGAFLPMLDDASEKADDAFRNADLTQKIPGVKQVVNASERHYNTMLSMLRLKSAERFIDKAGGIPALEKAATESGDPETFLKAIGIVTNTNTGRGELGNLGKDGSKILSNILISPRGLAAKIQRFNPAYYNDLRKANPAAFKEAIRSAIIQTTVTAGALTVAAKNGSYEDGQIRIGNTRYDLTGGAANILRTAVRMEQYVAGNREQGFGKSAEDEFVNWAKNQLSPAISTVRNLIGTHIDEDSGQRVNRWGEPVTPGSIALENVAPVGAEGIVSDIKQGTSGVQSAVNAGLNTLGIGVNTYQTAGDKDTAKRAETAPQVNGELTELRNNGILNDNMIKGFPKETQDLLKNGKQLAPDELEKVKAAIVSGVGTGLGSDSDTAYRERGDYETDAAVLKLKRDLLAAKPNTKPSDLKALDTQIKRSEILTKNDIPYDALEQYQNTDQDEWRKMGDDESDAYDPDTYAKLAAIDKLFADGGGSYKSGDSSKPKFVAKDATGGSKSKKVATDFGKLDGGGSYAPKVRQYDTASMNGLANIPLIRVQRPNIVHKIGTN